MKSHMLTKNVSRKHMASELATEFLKNSNSIPVGKAAGFPYYFHNFLYLEKLSHLKIFPSYDFIHKEEDNFN